MAAILPLDMLLSDWFFLLAPIVGLSSAGLVLVGGRLWLRSRRGKAPPPITVVGPDPFEEGSATERRSALRREGRHVRVYITDAAAEGQPMEGWVLDRSVGGVCLSVTRQIPIETIVSVRACNAPDTIPWTQIRVMRCRWEGGYYELGCEFLRTPSWATMLLFG